LLLLASYVGHEIGVANACRADGKIVMRVEC
jgi:hypothetical protein